ncbi:aromatic hydrocarbon degradation protein [Marinomonas piezotolerans]|uniref:Aromatic hydrocarbon degradation protein n=1 Tax=Marinomonas piezotolerans TaxID=2213058 RepID=A0A370U4H1_9GAMM|nr:outer membrane protein transport protein [Marinomonas piezotolerans]RDL42681.1 aromatic hydrocarbon degradation protein [Marinomonas piezotolerans]
MTPITLHRKTLLSVAIALSAVQLHAAGFQLNAQSATGLGRAFAGDSVIGDNASVIARNPAAMSLFDQQAISVGFETITTDIEVKDATYSSNVNPATPATTTNANTDSVGGTSIAPNFYYINPVSDKFAWGINAYSNYGTKTEFDEDYAGKEYGGKTDVKSLNLGIVGSYKVSPALTLGAGIDAVYGQGVFTRPDTDYSGGKDVLNIDANGWALGWNVGAMFELNSYNRFGLDYHYSPDIDAEGDVYKYNPASPNAAPVSDTVIMPLPDIAEFSGYHRLSPKHAVHYSIQYIQWSEFDKLETEKVGTIKEYNWKDAWHYAIGTTYYMNEQWELRAGYMYDTSAQDNTRSVSVPDSDRQWISAGFTFKPDTVSSIDFGATYLMGKDVEVKEATTHPQAPSFNISEINGTTHANAILLGLQYSRSF